VTHCMVFEYLYRDAGNYKAWGELLLEGDLSETEIARMKAIFQDGEFFIPEQIGIPSLCEQLWQACQSDPSDELDHVWHEFSTMRAACARDFERLEPWGKAAELLIRIEKVVAWDLSRSPNWVL